MVVIPNVDGEFDEVTLLSHLEKAKKQHPQKINGIIEVADDIPYDRFIKGMDNLLVSGFSQIDVAAGGI
jgi:biopolymer transport protein ExbD